MTDARFVGPETVGTPPPTVRPLSCENHWVEAWAGWSCGSPVWWGAAEPVRPTPRPLAKRDLGKRLLGMQGGVLGW